LHILDIKLARSAGMQENVNVPMDLYDQACITDAKQGVEVRFDLIFKTDQLTFV
jgi:hypothetical protein